MRVLFTGYAPVHFVCFAPIATRLRAEGHDVWTINEQADLELVKADAMNSDYDLWFVSHTRQPLNPKAYGKKIQIFHGCSFRNLALRDANADKDAYFAWGPRMTRGLLELGVDRSRIFNVGAPKTDKLLTTPKLPFQKPAILYAPTGAKGNSAETGLGYACMKALAQTGKYTLLYKPHDHPKRAQAPFTKFMHAHDEPDVCKLLPHVDLLITDASSVANEFCLLNRPIIFLDVPDLIARARTKGQFDEDGRDIGAVCSSPDAVVNLASWLGDAGPTVKRAERAKDLFYNPGRATDVAMDVIHAW